MLSKSRPKCSSTPNHYLWSKVQSWSPVPVALVEMNGGLRTGQKSVLADLITELELWGSLHVCLLIDGLALGSAIGRPSGTQTFGDFADSFQAAVLQAGSCYQHIHVIFDWYQEDSIKSGTRERRSKSTRPIWRVLERWDGSVPLPHSWPNFLALPDNTSDLARFLWEHIIANTPPDKVVVAVGGFVDEREVQSSERAIYLSALMATHREADTRVIAHCVNSSLHNIVLSSRDTDVLLLLVTRPHIPCPNLYMMSGSATKRKYFNIRAIYKNLPTGSVSALLPLDALTGCDTTSFICNHSNSLDSIPKASHTSFLTWKGRANRRKKWKWSNFFVECTN